MNKTFTNCAEKKAKQFFNLLQGYTKGIRMTAILILLLMGVSNPTNAGVFLAGSMNGWSQNANELKSVATDTWRSDIYLEANTTYEFKIVYNGTYCGNNGTINSTITNWSFTWDGGSNCTIKTTLAGPYTFKWVGNGNKLSVTYPTSKTYTVTVPEGTPDCYICGDMTKWEFRQMTKENNTEYKITINSTNTAEYKYACASSWGFQELNGNCNGTISNRTYNANDNVLCWSLKTIYFKPNSDWKQANARFEVNWWIDGESHSGWVDLVQTECDDYYVAQVPLYKAKVKFCRTNPNDFNNKWNTIDNQTVPTDDNNLFTVTGWESGSWSSSSRTITTNAGANGNITVSPGKTVNIGETVTVTITPDNNYKIKSYTIDGTTTNVSETGAKSFDLTICSNTEISAEFETTKSKYTVSFNMNGHGDAIAAQEIAEGEKVAKPTDPTATGYTFGGWYKDANCTNAWNFNTDVVTGNMTLYAKWTATEYTITYNNLYGVIHSNPTTYTIESETITFTNPTSERTGYTFKGWNPTGITKGSTGNKTVTAQWTINNYNITYTQPTNGSYTIKVGNGAAVTTNTTADYNTTITLANNPATGYHFSQWNITPEIEITNNTFSMPANDVKIGVTFALNTYSVKFNANGGTGQMADQSFDYNEKKALSTNNFTREGYAFLGWSTTSDGEVEYGDKAEVTNLTTTNNATVNLYAQWLSQTPTYTINFDKQNGTNGTSSATVQYQNNNYSVNPVVAPTRTDYTFGGYYTQAEGAGVQVVSAAGEWLKSVTGYTDASGNWIKNSSVTTLYAKWISNSTATEGLPTGVYLVGEVFNNWSSAPNQEFKKATESSTVYSLVVNLAEKKGYKFKVIDNGNWRGNSLESEFLTETKTSVILYKDGANNAECKITTTEAGEYIFTWDSETNTLSVEYPSDRVTVTFFGDGGTVGAVADDRVLTSPAKVKPGTSVTFTATPDANNAFSQWKKNGVVVSTDLTYTCTIDADATIEAVFLKPTTVFLKPHSTWLSDNARFAIYYWKSEQDYGWVNMKRLTCHNEYYTADVPVGYSQLQFVRLNPNTNENKWENVWNQTIDLTLPNDGKNLLDMTVQKMYLKPTDQWDFASARFAAHFYNNQGGEWMSMFKGMDGTQWCNIPQNGYTNVMFGRMNGSIEDNYSSDALWNKTNDLDIAGGNCYEITYLDDGYNDDPKISAGKWLWYGDWTKLELPTITITNTTPDFGDVVVKTTGGRIITNGEKVPFDTEVIVTLMPKNGYTRKTATIDGASLSEDTPYPICNNTTISVTFAIKEEWYVIGVDGDWETPQERFRFVDGQLEVELDTNITANFKIAYMQGTEILNRYGNKAFNISNKSQTLTAADNESGGDHCTIQTTYYGKYIFAWDAVNMKLTITYPLSVGDYRLAYQDSEDGSFHPERVIKKCIIGDRLDTVSFFVHHDKSPRLVLQQCATLQNGVGTWQTTDDNIEFSVGKTGVWNFVLQQTNNPTHSVQVLTDDIKPYEGDYYIRTKSAKDGWTYFRSDSHKMTYSSYADNNEPFSHYFCKWVATDAEAANKTKNVRYTIANDYGDCISDTLAADPEDANPRIVTNANGDLPTNSANVRFGWDWETNEIRRAYLAGSTGDSENTYLRLANGVALKNASNVSQTEIRFNDTENWIYQLDVIATKSTKVNLTALYNGSLQYFKGGPTMTNEQDDRIGLLSDDASSDITFNIRLVYDFKTNHLIVAWVPDNGKYDGTLGANMMMIREHDYKNGEGTVAVTQLNLQNEGLTDVDTVYAVMTFTQNWINKPSRTRDQSIYWVSFPFDVKLSDAFGFGEYADAWIIQYYDGAERAKKGLFSDSGTYWKYIFNPDGVVLRKGVGYVLVLDLDKIQFNHGVTSVSLYFPSSEGVETISPDLPEGITVPGHKCEITTGSIDHTITDSHWNLIGVPAFKDVTEFDVKQYHFAQDDASFYYRFLTNDSRYEVVNSSNTTFQAMYSYMVQFAGTINWRLKEVIFNENQQLAARRNADNTEPEKVSLRLEIAQDEVMADQTFVQLQQEGATADFDMNLDLTKIINSGANIYTLAGEQRIQSAGNALPMGEAIVPVGVQIATEGEYTFRMPDGTEGMVVELLDYETNTRTNLLLSDYIVTLPKGTEENRFALHIQPEKDVTTGVGNVGDEAKGIEKYLIDGKLIIRTAEGAVYDAQGKRM